MFELNEFSLLIFVAALLNIFTSYVSWQRQKTQYGLFFALGMIGVSGWTLAEALDYAARSLATKIFFAKLETLGYNLALGLFAVFAIVYAGHESWLKKTWVRLVFILIPLVNILLALTNDWHGWFWSAFETLPTAPDMVVFVHGPAFAWAALMGYLLVGVIAFNLLQVAFTGMPVFRRQARLLLFALMVPVASNLFYLFENFRTPGVDWTSVTFSVTGLIFLWALYGLRFMNIAPIARHTLIERMEDGVFVLDGRGNLVDFNPAAQAILGIRQTDLWRPIQNALSKWPEVVALLETPTDPVGREISLPGPNKFFDVRLSLLGSERGDVNGRLVVMRDITDRKRMEESLRRSEEKLSKAFHSSPDAIVITRLNDGWIVEVNDGFTRLLGYSRQEAMKVSTLDLGLWLNPGDRVEAVEQVLQTGQLSEREYQFRAKSGSVITALYSGEVIRLGEELHLLSTLHDITRRKQAEARLLEAQAQLLAQQRELARTEERQRVARNLHDSLSQSIHSLVLFTETLDAMVQRGNFERVRRIVGQVQESARQAHKETRLLLYELQDSAPERTIDLVGDLEARLAKVERHSGVKADLQVDGSLEDCLPEWQENLFWITIEALNNALKHAQARKVQVRLQFTTTGAVLEVCDDGKGFDPLSLRGGGMGMTSMHARAQQLGGTLTMESSPGRGTLVRCEVKQKAGG